MNPVNLLFKLSIVFVLFLGFIATSLSQIKKQQDTPLLPSVQLRTEAGGFIGIGENIQSGILRTDTSCQCDYEDGRGFGFTIGGLYESEFTRRLFWGGALAFDLRSFWASFKQREQLNMNKDGNIYEVPAWFRYRADVNTWYLTLMPYLKYIPAKFMFLRLGFGSSFVLSSTLNHNKELLDRSGKISTGETISLRIDSTKSSDGINAKLYNGSLPDLNSMQFSLEPALGFNFLIGEKFRFSPVFQYSVPLTILTQNGQDVKLSSWRILFELRYDITPEEKF